MMVAGWGLKVVVATRAVDLRKGHDGLVAVVEPELGLDPYSGIVVVFRPKRVDRLKVLWWDGTGARIEASGAGSVRVAGGSRRGDAPVAGAVRGVVRGTGLAPGVGATGAPAARGGVMSGAGRRPASVTPLLLRRCAPRTRRSPSATAGSNTWCASCAGRCSRTSPRSSIPTSSCSPSRSSKARSPRPTPRRAPRRRRARSAPPRSATSVICRRTCSRVFDVIEPQSTLCPCGCSEMTKIGEDRTERLHVVPAKLQVIVTVRPKYAWGYPDSVDG